MMVLFNHQGLAVIVSSCLRSVQKQGPHALNFFSGHLRQYHDFGDDTTKFCFHKANLRQKT